MHAHLELSVDKILWFTNTFIIIIIFRQQNRAHSGFGWSLGSIHTVPAHYIIKGASYLTPHQPQVVCVGGGGGG